MCSEAIFVVGAVCVRICSPSILVILLRYFHSSSCVTYIPNAVESQMKTRMKSKKKREIFHFLFLPHFGRFEYAFHAI